MIITNVEELDIAIGDVPEDDKHLAVVKIRVYNPLTKVYDLKDVSGAYYDADEKQYIIQV